MSTPIQKAIRGAALAAGVAALQSTMAAAAASRSAAQAPLATERDKVAHLLRRAGFGYSQADLDAFAQLGVGGAINRLLGYDQVDDRGLEDRLASLQLNLYNQADLQRWWLLRMAYTKRPLLEKMTLFWHGLLVSGTGKVGINQPKPDDPPDAPKPPHHMLNQNRFFRENALADFGTILKGISRDPAMVIYLDSSQNRKASPNENYARELMELFTLGITGPDGAPSYTETDVREVARAFTGWGLNKEQQFAFNPNQHDNGAKTVFGQTGTFNGDDVIDLIVAHPSCAYYLSTRLWQFFAYDSPTLDVLQPVMDTFKRSGGSVREMLRAIFTHPAFYSEVAYRARAKSPAELVAGLIRALEVETNGTGLPGSLQRMGQQLFNPPNVAGWPGGAQWFNTTSWLERVNTVNRLVTVRKDPNTQPVDLLPMLQRNTADTPEKVADLFLGLFLDGLVRQEQRQALLAYLADGSLWPKPGVTLKSSDPAVDRKARGLAYLVLAMPEFNLA